MSIKTRGLVFATFFGNCIVVGVLMATLTTDHWITADAKRYNSTNATGLINFGLFTGVQTLNVGIGNRTTKIDVLEFMRKEPHTMSYWLWLGAFLGTGFALFSSAVGAIASVIKSASMSKKRGTMYLLLISNSSSAMSQIIAFACWIAQFYQYLSNNVLAVADRENNWYTTDMSKLGHSFYLVVVGIVVVIVNIAVLIIAHRMEKRERRPINEEPYDEKMAGAIMLY